jgi:putative membrane protein
MELGVGRTHDRNGILVLVSLFERRASLVPDVGIDAAALGPEWKARVDAVEASLEGGPSIDRFVEALRALAAPLAAAMPHRDDDVNELPDEVA